MALKDIPVVYIIGAPRSGTTWLQRMLGCHPEIASPQEIELLNGYVAPLRAEWARQLPSTEENWRRMRYKGLPSVLTEAEFHVLLTEFVEAIYQAVLERKPKATILLEKTPTYSLELETVRAIVPHARFIHMVRDGRDVASSLIGAASTWGDWWAPRELADAARSWKTHVESARSAANRGHGYLEVRYEELLSEEGVRLLCDVLNFCRTTDRSLGTAERLYRRFSGPHSDTTGGIVWGGEVAARVIGEPVEPTGFRGPGIAGNWRHTFSGSDRRIFDFVAGDLLMTLGYESERTWARSAWVPSTVVRTELLSRRLKASARRGLRR